jgi:hypothetical protein
MLVSHTTAVGLGVLTTLVAGGVTEANAIEQALTKKVELTLPAGAASTFETFVDNQFCPQVESVFGLEADDCDLDMIKDRALPLCQRYDAADGDWVMWAMVNGMPGSWTPQEPQ